MSRSDPCEVVRVVSIDQPFLDSSVKCSPEIGQDSGQKQRTRPGVSHGTAGDRRGRTDGEFAPSEPVCVCGCLSEGAVRRYLGGTSVGER